MTTHAPPRERAAPDERSEKYQVKIGGMHCSLCTDSIRRAVGRLDGVQDVQVSIAHEEALIAYNPARVTPVAIQDALEDLGYTVHAPDQAELFAQEEQEHPVLLREPHPPLNHLVVHPQQVRTVLSRSALRHRVDQVNRRDHGAVGADAGIGVGLNTQASDGLRRVLLPEHTQHLRERVAVERDDAMITEERTRWRQWRQRDK